MNNKVIEHLLKTIQEMNEVLAQREDDIINEIKEILSINVDEIEQVRKAMQRLLNLKFRILFSKVNSKVYYESAYSRLFMHYVENLKVNTSVAREKANSLTVTTYHMQEFYKELSNLIDLIITTYQSIIKSLIASYHIGGQYEQ